MKTKKIKVDPKLKLFVDLSNKEYAEHGKSEKFMRAHEKCLNANNLNNMFYFLDNVKGSDADFFYRTFVNSQNPEAIYRAALTLDTIMMWQNRDVPAPIYEVSKAIGKTCNAEYILKVAKHLEPCNFGMEYLIDGLVKSGDVKVMKEFAELFPNTKDHLNKVINELENTLEF